MKPTNFIFQMQTRAQKIMKLLACPEKDRIRYPTYSTKGTNKEEQESVIAGNSNFVFLITFTCLVFCCLCLAQILTELVIKISTIEKSMCFEARFPLKLR